MKIKTTKPTLNCVKVSLVAKKNLMIEMVIIYFAIKISLNIFLQVRTTNAENSLKRI